MIKTATLGTCLSNLTAVQLEALFACRRTNNLVIGRSDHFLNHFIRKTQTLPAIEEVENLLGLTETDPNNIHFSLVENYPSLAGVADLAKGSTPLLQNLMYDKLDIIVMDNLGDTSQELVLYENFKSGPATINFPIGQAPNAEEFWKHCKIIPRLSGRQSAMNWLEIIRFVSVLQPAAKIFFICAHHCTSIDQPDRYQRAVEFFNELSKAGSELPVTIISPLSLPPTLTKMPDDREHLDTLIYRGLAGHIFLSHAAQWPKGIVGHAERMPSGLTIGVKAENLDAGGQSKCLIGARTSIGTSVSVKEAAIKQIHVDVSLRSTIAQFLSTTAEEISESSGAFETNNWDSLTQINLAAWVEEVFQVKLTFDDITNANSVTKIRAALRRLGVIANDEPVLSKAKCVSSNLFEPFARRALAEPGGRYALVVSQQKEVELTNGWILGHAMGLVARFADLAKGSVIAIVLEHSSYLYSSFIGCVLGGLIPTNLPPLTSKQDPDIFKSAMVTLFERIQPAIILTSRQSLSSIPETSAPIIFVEDIAPEDWAAVELAVERAVEETAPSDIAFLQHSSGTTGGKKGVMLTHEKVLRHVDLYADSIQILAGDPIVSWLPLYHDMGLLTSFILPTLKGCDIISLDALEWVSQPLMLFDYIEKTEAKFAWLPNFAFDHIVRSDRSDMHWNLSSVKAIINCSEACRARSFETFLNRYGSMGLSREQLGVSYGMAENVFAVTQTLIGEKESETVKYNDVEYLSSGYPLADVELQIRDERGAPVGSGHLGEICIRSSCLFDGYFQLPQVTAERLEGGWYKSRDLGMLVKGQLFVVGRVDDLLIVNGRNLIAHEIEDILGKIPGVVPGRVMMFAEHDDETGATKLVALAESLNDDEDSRGRLAASLRNSVYSTSGISLARAHIIPRGFLVKSTSGKLARAQSLAKWKLQEKELAT